MANITDHTEPTRFSRLFPESIAEVGEDVQHYEDRAARVWLLSAVVWFGFVTMLGLTMATELVTPNLFGGIPYLVFSRLRQMHVNGVVLAWLSSAFIGAAFYMVPRLAGVRSLWSERLGVWSAVAWNCMYGAGISAMAIGWTQSREYWEFIWPVDVLAALVMMAVITNVVLTVLNRRIRPLYVATWWFMTGPVWLLADMMLANVIWRPGNVLGNGIMAGALSGALPYPLPDLMLNWWGAHNLFGLWLTPMLIGITYYLVPRITNTPLYSHALSLISFWGLVFLYTSVGGHHVMQAPIPIWARTFATFYSILLLIPVMAFFTNVWLTMRQNWDRFALIIPLRFVLTGFIMYILVNIQGAFMSVQSFNRLVHFTNFTVAHAHLCLFGGMSFVAVAAIHYIIPQIYRRPMFSRGLAELQYWLMGTGIFLFVLILMFAAFVQGQNWMHGIPEVNVLPMLIPHYVVRAVAGVLMFSGAIVQIINVWLTIATSPENMSNRLRRSAMPYVEA